MRDKVTELYFLLDVSLLLYTQLSLAPLGNSLKWCLLLDHSLNGVTVNFTYQTNISETQTWVWVGTLKPEQVGDTQLLPNHHQFCKQEVIKKELREACVSLARLCGSWLMSSSEDHSPGPLLRPWYRAIRETIFPLLHTFCLVSEGRHWVNLSPPGKYKPMFIS